MEAVVVVDGAAIDGLIDDDAVEKTVLLPFLGTLGVVSVVKNTASKAEGGSR